MNTSKPMARLRKKEVMSRVGWGKSKLNQMVSDGKFPAPTYEGFIPYWLESDVDNFIAEFFKQDSAA